ncbi:MAG: ribonuclease HII [Elusimicrobia bacterium]|nr:ribonuclease HII [Elusimicrobiota bacterium]
MPEALFAYDKKWREKGFFLLAGVDEAGRGPWAGPVAAAAVVLRPDTLWPELNDSKKLSPAVRESLFEKILQEALFSAVRLVPSDIIDEKNILQATFLAMAQAVRALGVEPALVLVDGNHRIPHLPARTQETVVGGDGKSASIAAASVLAKVTRDRWMAEAHKQFPQYNFAGNKGYGTPDHIEALRRYGPSPLHRKSFAPIRKALAPELPFEPVA